MSDKSFEAVVEALMHGMNGLMSSKTVVGEATTVGDTIIIPLVDVSFGIGAGSSDSTHKAGGVGGMGAKMSPNAVLVVKDGKAKLVNIKNQDTITKVIDLIPDLIDKVMPKKKDEMSDHEITDIAFPAEEETEI